MWGGRERESESEGREWINTQRKEETVRRRKEEKGGKETHIEREKVCVWGERNRKPENGKNRLKEK